MKCSMECSILAVRLQTRDDRGKICTGRSADALAMTIEGRGAPSSDMCLVHEPDAVATRSEGTVAARSHGVAEVVFVTPESPGDMVMVHMAMDFVVMAFIVMAYIVMAYVVMALLRSCSSRRSCQVI